MVPFHQALVKRGYTVWIDWNNIPPIADWMLEIQEGITSADNFVFIISPNSVISKECHKELEFAIKHHKKIIPVVFEEVGGGSVDSRLASINWIFFRDFDDISKSFEALVSAFETDLDYVKNHTRLLFRAVEWQQKHKNPAFLLHGDALAEAQHLINRERASQPELSPLQVQYVNASQVRLTQQQRKLSFSLGFGLVLAAGLTLAAIWQAGIAQQRKYEALANEAQTLLQLSENYSYSHDRLSALATALAASEQLSDLPAPRPSLYAEATSVLGQVMTSISEKNRWYSQRGRTWDTVFNPQGDLLATASGDGVVKIWTDRKSTRLNSSHVRTSRMPSSA